MAAVTLVPFVAGDIAEHAADRRADEGSLGIATDRLADERTAPGPQQQAVDAVAPGHRIPCYDRSCKNCCRDRHLQSFHGMILRG